MYHYTESGLDNVKLANGYREIDLEGVVAVAITDVEGLHAAIARHILEAPDPLSGQELRFLRVEMDLSQKALGTILRVSDQTIANWEKGVHKIDGAAEILFRKYAAERLLHREGTICELLEELSALEQHYDSYNEVVFSMDDHHWREVA